AQRGGAAGEYFVALDAKGRVLVALSHAAGEEVQLRAYVHALYLARHADVAVVAAAGAAGGGGGSSGVKALVDASERWVRGGYGAWLGGVEAAGWSSAGASLPRAAWTGKWG
ncbi:hypothetical protein MNEG_16738, partial [Monoraphidium neglectum]